MHCCVNDSYSNTFPKRVMPSSFFILARFTLRVDNVLFRTFDTRIFHSFHRSPPLIIREMSGWEAFFDDIRRVKCCALFLHLLMMMLLEVFTQFRRSHPFNRFKLYCQDTVKYATAKEPGCRGSNRLACVGNKY